MSRRLIAPAAALAAALGVVPGAANAQAGIASEEECARAPSPEEELACLREALAASREALRRAEPAPRELASVPATPPRAGAPAPDLGQEQVARAEPRGEVDRADALTATVTDVREDVRGLLVMQLDNGQIWRQDESAGGPIRLGEIQQAGVEITRSGFGGYRMRFPELGRRIAVSRLR